jgi:hypothetical protein
VEFKEFTWLVNEDQSRSFLVGIAAAGESTLLDFIRHTDMVFESFGLETFYKDPVPHFSFGWVLGDIFHSKPEYKNKRYLFPLPLVVTLSLIVFKSGKWTFQIKKL